MYIYRYVPPSLLEKKKEKQKGKKAKNVHFFFVLVDGRL